MPRPNLLLIHTDQQRYDAIGAQGNEEIHTPNIDALAEQGVSFQRCFIQSPVCMPSRASYLTGQYPSQLRIFNNGVPLPEDTRTLPRLLSSRDYVSANVGKLHFRPHSNRNHREPHPSYGFDHLEISETPGLYEDAYRDWIRREAPEQLDKISVGLPPGTAVWRRLMEQDDEIPHPDRQPGDAGDLSMEVDDASSSESALSFVDPKKPIPHPADEEYTHTAFVANQTIDFIEEHSDDRFLCVSGFWAPHLPYIVPQRFIDQYDPSELSLPEFPPELEDAKEESEFTDQTLRNMRHGYYAAVSEIDHHLSRIFDRLDELGLRENTIVVFTSDHGEYLGEHLKAGKGFPGEDCVSRVPFIIRWPDGVVDPGRTVPDIVEMVDLVPTLLDCCGVQRPLNLKGTSLRPALKDEPFEGQESALLEGGAREMEGRTVRTDRFRYVFRSNGDEELYDLDREFGEYRDVSEDSEYRDTLTEMRHKLLTRMNDLDTPRPRTWVY